MNKPVVKKPTRKRRVNKHQEVTAESFMRLSKDAKTRYRTGDFVTWEALSSMFEMEGIRLRWMNRRPRKITP